MNDHEDGSMTDQQKTYKTLAPGEIKLSWCPRDWPLTPLGSKKNPYLAGWQNNPLTAEEIQAEMMEGSCKAVGLIAGPCFNLDYGLIWVDVDGPSVHALVESLSHLEYSSALPSTLTLCSGKPGRERKLYKIFRNQQEILARNKYIWRSYQEGEKLELLCKNMQGALMGLHPETEGYYTPEGLGFEWVDDLPTIPDWILECVTEKNVRQGLPMVSTTTVTGPNFTIRLEKSLDRDMQVAVDALWALPSEIADDYAYWIKVGQILHSIDDSLLEQWDSWSQQSESYQPGCCDSKWGTFKNDGGVGLGSLIYMHKELGTGFSIGPSEDDMFGVSDEALEELAQQIELAHIGVDQSLRQNAVLAEIIGMQQDMLQELGEETETDFGDEADLVHAMMGRDEEADPSRPVRTQAKRNPPASEISGMVLKMLEGDLVFNPLEEKFYQYGAVSPGLWSPLIEMQSERLIKEKMEMVQLPRGYTPSLIADVAKLVAQDTMTMKWDLHPQLLNFKNGMLDPIKMEFTPHKKEVLSTSQLPYAYNPLVDCPKVKGWLNFTQEEDQDRVQLLRAWLRAVLLSRPELQVFLELIGAANAGKSSFSNLCAALVGYSNTYSTNLDQLENNKFEPAGCYNKKLVTMADASRYGGKVVVLKQLLGQDAIQLEKKYMREKHQFYFRGMIITTANEPIQTTDLTSGMLRRRITVPFKRPFVGDPKDYKTLINFNDQGNPYGEFADELPGLVNWLLDMDEDTMLEYLKNPSKKVSYIDEIRSEQMVDNNPIMDWMDTKVVYDPDVATWIGERTDGSGKDYYANTDKYLYASYCDFARKSNLKEMSRRRFMIILGDICSNQLKIDIKQMRTKQRWHAFRGLALRISNPRYSEYPSIVEFALNKDKYTYIYGQVVDVGSSTVSKDQPEAPTSYLIPGVQDVDDTEEKVYPF